MKDVPGHVLYHAEIEIPWFVIMNIEWITAVKWILTEQFIRALKQPIMAVWILLWLQQEQELHIVLVLWERNFVYKCHSITPADNQGRFQKSPKGVSQFNAICVLARNFPTMLFGARMTHSASQSIKGPHVLLLWKYFPCLLSVQYYIDRKYCLTILLMKGLSHAP